MKNFSGGLVQRFDTGHPRRSDRPFPCVGTASRCSAYQEVKWHEPISRYRQGTPATVEELNGDGPIRCLHRAACWSRLVSGFTAQKNTSISQQNGSLSLAGGSQSAAP